MTVLFDPRKGFCEICDCLFLLAVLLYLSCLQERPYSIRDKRRVSKSHTLQVWL